MIGQQSGSVSANLSDNCASSWWCTFAVTSLAFLAVLAAAGEGVAAAAVPAGILAAKGGAEAELLLLMLLVLPMGPNRCMFTCSSEQPGLVLRPRQADAVHSAL